jgi:hypothetical protein
MSKPRFFLPKFSYSDKDLDISSNDYIQLSVDFDDVDHYAVEALLPLVVKALNNIPKDEWDAAIRKAQQKSKEERD